MAVEPAVDDFLEFVERSGLVPQNQMEPLLAEFHERTDLDTSGKIADELVAREVLTRWQASKLLAGKHKGFILGPYRILRPLGKGGMGTVYLAEHRVMRRQCAVKVLPSISPDDDPTMLDRFYREAQAVAALDHPNIVRAYDVNKDVQRKTEVHYLVMEYVGGQDLQAKVDEQGWLGYREAAEYIRQAAEGLTHAHEAGLVHRDVKPANLLVDAKGVVKILDLGLARFFDDSEGASLTNQFGDTVLGTVDYLAPEQALDCHEADARADIYSLGQTFHFLLTEHPPFPEGSVAQRLMAHQTRMPEPIVNQRPDVSPELVAIIDRMTAKKPEERYQTATEVEAALSAWLGERSGDSGVLPRTASLGRRFPPPAESTRSLPREPRPSAYREPTRARSSPAEDTDLELAPLDDEERPRPPSDSKSGAGKQTDKQTDKRIGEPSPADSAATQPSGEPAAPSPPADSAATQASGEPAAPSPPADSQAKTPEEVNLPELADELPDLAAPQEDWMSTLIESEALSESAGDVGPQTLPSRYKPPPKKADEKRQEGLSGNLMKTPAVWIGVAGVAVVVLIVTLVLVLSSPNEGSRPSTASEPPSLPPTAQTPAPSAAVPGQTGEISIPAGVELVEPPQPHVGAGGPVTPTNPGETGPGEAPAVGPAPIADAEGGIRPPMPETTEQPAPPQTGKSPPAPSPETEPTKPDPAELRRRFAAITQISFQLKSVDSSPNSKLNLLVKQQAIQAAERAGLNVTMDDDAVMLYLTLETTKVEELVGFLMSAELKCRDSDEQVLTVWSHKEQVASVAPHLLRRAIFPAALRTGVGDFFDRFVHDYRQAQPRKPDRER
ncbi:MAG: protein kinase [Planctomycetota bacterium]